MLNHFLAIYRHHRFARQLRHIHRTILALPQHRRTRLASLALREIGQSMPGGGSPTAPDRGWTDPARTEGTDLAYARACSANSEVALRGIALWLAAAYHQTRALPHPLLRPQHRQVLRVVRELKHLHSGSQGSAGAHWLRTVSAA